MQRADTDFNPGNAALLRARTTELLLDVGMFPFVMHLLVLALVLLVLLPGPAGLVWAAGLAGCILFQIRLLNGVFERPLSVETAGAVAFRFTAAASVVALFWGLAGFVLVSAPDAVQLLFLSFVVGGMAMSVVATQHMALTACIVSIWVGVPPLALRYALSDLPFALPSAGLLLLYAIVLTNLALRLHRFNLRTFRLQLEQQGLLNELSEQAGALEAARGEAERANDAKSRFLAQASHDLRQPLHAISLFVESLPGARNAIERNDIMNRVRQSLDVLTKLFDSLLDVTLLDTGGIEVRRSVFRPSDLIAEVIRDFGLVAEACQVELRHVRSSVAVESDPVLVRRMLQNLVSNAIRHSEGGRVLMGCRSRNGSITIVVADTGPGIETQDQKRIFSEFERLETARMGTSATPGLGLGLSIVTRIAKELELNVRLISEAGHGSMFRVEDLPKADASRVEQLAQPAVVGPAVSDAEVFILDDDAETLNATQLLLERWGYHARSSQDWRDLLEASPDVVICDYEISPSKTGLDVLEELAGKKGAPVPAILISGHTSTALRKRAADCGIPLLHKPIRPVQLRSALLNALADQENPRAAAKEAAAARLGSDKVRNTAET